MYIRRLSCLNLFYSLWMYFGCPRLTLCMHFYSACSQRPSYFSNSCFKTVKHVQLIFILCWELFVSNIILFEMPKKAASLKRHDRSNEMSQHLLWKLRSAALVKEFYSNNEELRVTTLEHHHLEIQNLNLQIGSTMLLKRQYISKLWCLLTAGTTLMLLHCVSPPRLNWLWSDRIWATYINRCQISGAR